ncbi:hypothetical protein VULLAG_LOCUS6942 [Vulpes lagopus]
MFLNPGYISESPGELYKHANTHGLSKTDKMRIW